MNLKNLGAVLSICAQFLALKLSTRAYKIRGRWKYFGHHRRPAFVVLCKGFHYVFYDYVPKFIGLYEKEEAEIFFRTTVDIVKLRKLGISQIELESEVCVVDKAINHIMSER